MKVQLRKFKNFWHIASAQHNGYLHTSHKQSQHFDVQSKSSGSRQNKRSTRDFAREFLWSSKHYRPGQKLKRLGKSCSLHSKKNFGWGTADFCEWRHKWRTFRPPWPTLPGTGPKLLDGSISLKFSLETRLQFKYFDTLDDLLGFQVQKLWSKVKKIFD